MFRKLFKEENKNLIFLFLFFSLIIVSLPRFDRADYGPIKKFVGYEELYEGLPYDILIYKRYIEYFRTGQGEGKIHSPYTQRIFVPFMASYLPFAPLTSFNLVNLTFLLIGLICLYQILIKLMIDFEFRVIGCLLYIFSFPLFYYGTSGYIDGTIIGMMMAACYFTISRKWLLLFIVICCGTLASEKTIILLPFFVAYLYTKKINFKTSLYLVLIFVSVYIITIISLRKFAPSSEQSYVWIPGMEFIMQNIFRPKTYLSFLITFGLPGLLAIISYFKLPAEIRRSVFYFYVGCATSIVLYLFSIFSAWADGRTVWTSYPFTIPLAVLYLQSRNSKKMITRLM